MDGAITVQIRFIVANVQSALLGVPDIDDNNVTVDTGKQHIEKNGLVEQLPSFGAHLHAAAMVLPGFHKPNEIKLDNSVNSRYNPSKPTTFNTPISPNNYDNHHNQQNENKNNIGFRTCHTGRGAQFASRPKENQPNIDMEA
eukprot:4473083-Amphidinium_carterae.1